jgi:hypothetical protein
MQNTTYKGTRSLGRHRRTPEDNIKNDLKEICDSWTGFICLSACNNSRKAKQISIKFRTEKR